MMTAYTNAIVTRSASSLLVAGLLYCQVSTASAFMLNDQPFYATAEVPISSATSSASADSSLLSEQPATQPVQPVPVRSSPTSSAPALPPMVSSATPSLQQSSSSASSVSSLTAEEQKAEDGRTLSEIEAYAHPDDVPLEEQLTQLAAGFSVTGTSTLGNPLPVSQRDAILRSSVETLDQLRLFAKALTESDERLRKFVVDDTTVTMTYRGTARFFGLIPMSYLVTVDVSLDGTIIADGPWWLLFAADAVEQLQADTHMRLTDLLTDVSDELGQNRFQLLADIMRQMHEAAKISG